MTVMAVTFYADVDRYLRDEADGKFRARCRDLSGLENLKELDSVALERLLLTSLVRLCDPAVNKHQKCKDGWIPQSQRVNPADFGDTFLLMAPSDSDFDDSELICLQL